jgi:hypothetical protein
MNVDNLTNAKVRDGEKGAAMIMALLISFLLLTASAGLLLESSMNAANVTDAVAEQQAYHAAESGIQSAVHVLRCQKNTNPGCSDVVATPLIVPSASPTAPINQITYTKAVDPLYSNTTGQEADVPRLSRWLNYSQTCGPDDVLCVALNQNGYAYSLELDDPDNTSSFVSFWMNGRFFEMDIGAGGSVVKTYPGVSPNHWLRFEYTPPPAINDYDMSAGLMTTPFGTLTITRGPSGGAIVPADNRFEIHFRMTRPYDAVKSVRGWIRTTNSDAQIPKVIFDSQTMTLAGSAVTLDLATAPSTGWSSIRTVTPDDNEALIGYEAQPALGANVIGGNMTPPEPIRLFIKSTGYGPRGARKELQAIIQKNFFNSLTAPAALTLVGPHRTGRSALNPTAPLDEPLSNFYFSLGQSAVLQYSGQDQVTTDIIPPIGTNNPVSLDCVENYILNVPVVSGTQCSDSYPNPNGANHFGGEIEGSPSDVTIDMPYWLQSPAALDREIHKLAGTARSSGRYFPDGVTPTGLGNFASGTGLTFCDGNIEVSNNGPSATGDGGGILVVTGSLTVRGAWNFKGLIIVTGPAGILRSGGGGGDAEIVGNVIVAPYVNNRIVDRIVSGSPVDDTAGIFLAPHYNMDGGGNSNLQFNSASLQSGLTAISNFVLGVMER